MGHGIGDRGKETLTFDILIANSFVEKILSVGSFNVNSREIELFEHEDYVSSFELDTRFPIVLI